MKLYPRGFGGQRTPPDKLKRDGWRNQGVLVISADDPRLAWPQRELIRQIGETLYGTRKEASNGW
ncbi:conserved hypothetical protein [uncultured Gammaproteobacteria bacterium]